MLAAEMFDRSKRRVEVVVKLGVTAQTVWVPNQCHVTQSADLLDQQITPTIPTGDCRWHPNQCAIRCSLV